MDALGVRFRPHVKTTKCLPVVRAQLAAGARGITVSTLKEAEQFHAAGIDDILYAVGFAPAKLPHVLALRRGGCDLKIVVDNVEAARAIGAYGREHGEAFEAWIEIDTDGHRSGVAPQDDLLLAVGRALRDGGARLGGVMTHAGSSYDCSDRASLVALAEQERAGAVRAAERLRAAGLPCPVVSVGSTPTALSAERLDGVTEVRAGVYVFFDLVMRNVGVCDRGRHRAQRAHHGDRAPGGQGLGDRRRGLDGPEPRPRHAEAGARLRLRPGLHRVRRGPRRVRRQRRQPGARHRVAAAGVDRGHRRTLSRSARGCASCRTTPARPARSTPSTTRSGPGARRKPGRGSTAGDPPRRVASSSGVRGTELGPVLRIIVIM